MKKNSNITYDECFVVKHQEVEEEKSSIIRIFLTDNNEIVGEVYSRRMFTWEYFAVFLFRWESILQIISASFHA